MITYELAKKLKEAGWDKDKERWPEPKGDGEKLPFPTLSELIEECIEYGRPIEIIINPDIKSSAKVVGRPDHYNGNSPEEAVANLWLKLNKKNGKRI